MQRRKDIMSDRKVSRRVCPHCRKSVSFKTYKAHRRHFYDSSADQWLLNEEDNQDIHDGDNPPTSFGESHDDHMDCVPSLDYHDQDAVG